MAEKMLITAALPYANGDLHIGHLVEYIQADIFVRFQKLIGNDALYICASDTHGTPIELNAKKQGIRPEELVKRYHDKHEEDLKSFLVRFDNFYTTHSPENKELSELFFRRLNDKGYIYKKKMDVIFCEKCSRSLPDRFVKGECRNCGAKDQYGDVCESCGITHKGSDLINPKCVVCGEAPIMKESEHYFFRLSDFSDRLRSWLNDNDMLQPEIKNHILSWIDKGLDDWCISRDSPYFGFKIPGEEDKYFYVWMDAPIGYIASTKKYCDDDSCTLDDYWGKESRSSLIHIIGKDIMYFHFLFWPAMLMAAEFKLPDYLIVHGFLTVNGEKMSKSRGTFFTAKDFIKAYSPELLRYYYAFHLSRKLSDIDLSFTDFTDSINKGLIANLGNFVYRVLSFTEKNYGGIVDDPVKDETLITDIHDKITHIKEAYEDFNLKEAMKYIMAISSIGNTYFQSAAPWKDPVGSKEKVALCVNLVRDLSILIKPVMPLLSSKIESYLGEKDLRWDDITFRWKGKVSGSRILVDKVELISRSIFPAELVVGKILSVEDHPNAEKLYLIDVDIGKERRKLVAGLKGIFTKDALLDKDIVICKNLKKAKIRGIESEGMILAADDGNNISLLEADGDPGRIVLPKGYSSQEEEITFDDFLKLGLKVGKEGEILYQGAALEVDNKQIKVIGIREGGSVR